MTVHPRTGGEHTLARSFHGRLSGSSPHGRGTFNAVRGGERVIRFIPARAGNIAAACRSRRSCSVHPRTGGEHTTSTIPYGSGGGSSPHGRGTCLKLTMYGGAARFIPARAGNIHFRRHDGFNESVHPRTGGEHQLPDQVSDASPGSSPHGRGTLFGPLHEQARERFIPARAGNMICTPPLRFPPSVHPRTGGEHCVIFSGNR